MIPSACYYANETAGATWVRTSNDVASQPVEVVSSQPAGAGKQFADIVGHALGRWNALAKPLGHGWIFLDIRVANGFVGYVLECCRLLAAVL